MSNILIQGWMFIGFSRDYRPRQVVSRTLMGESVVVFRTASGALHMLDAHCSHLGVHLGAGRVRGECLQCPMHGRLFRGDGAATHSKYRGVHAYPVHEDHGLVFAYFDRKGVPPRWEPPKYFDGPRRDWRMSWTHHDVYTTSHPSQLLENAVDARHFAHTHRFFGRKLRDTEFTAAGHTACSIMEITLSNKLRRLFPRYDVFLESRFDGPLNVELRHGDGRPESILHFATIIDAKHTEFRLVQVGLYGGARGVMSNIGARALAPMAFFLSWLAMREDRPLWNHRKYLPDPDLYADEVAIAQYRTWFAQFVVPKEELQRRHDLHRQAGPSGAGHGAAEATLAALELVEPSQCRSSIPF